MFIKHLLVITEQGTKKSLSKSQKIFSHINYFKSLLQGGLRRRSLLSAEGGTLGALGIGWALGVT